MSTATEKRKFKITCHECEEKIDANFSLQDGDHLYCLDCYLRRCGHQLLLDYGYKPRPRFNYMSFEKNPLYMGIELEVEANSDRNDDHSERYDDDDEDSDDDHDDDDDDENATTYLKNQAYYIMKNYPCYIKYDGSLNDCGMEIVSHPNTVKYHKRIFNWEKLLDYLKQQKFTSYENNRCGLHIHISKDFFKAEDYLKFNIFFDKNYDRMKRFSKRTKTNYCVKIDDSQTREIIRLKKEARLENWYDHYKCLYFGNYSTIELRIFRGTLSIERFNATLDITEALSYFVKSYSLAFFIKATKKQIWYNFLSFMKQAGRYNKLIKYLKKVNLLSCDIKRIPLKGKEIKSLIVKKPLTEFFANDEIRAYLKYKVIEELEYYFDDFENYEIHEREDVFYINSGDSGSQCLPIMFNKIILKNSILDVETRWSIILHFLNFGFCLELQNKNINTKIVSMEKLAENLGIDIDAIERVVKEEMKAEAEINKPQAPPEEEDIFTIGLQPRYNLDQQWDRRDYYLDARVRDLVWKKTKEALDDKNNEHLYFIITRKG